MKYFISIYLIAIFSFSCNFSKKDEGEYFGKKIDPKASVTVAQLENMLGGKGVQRAKVEGDIDAVCQTKGCWMDLKKPDGGVMRVTFKDYEFFVPKDANGKKATVEGVAYYDTTSVEMLQHYAEDAGKSAEEIMKIKEPRLELVFEAEGVYIH